MRGYSSRSFRTINKHYSQLLPLVLALIVGACDSGSGLTAPPDVEIDDSPFAVSPLPGTLEIGDAGRILSFTVLEDGVLDGLFQTSQDSTETGDVADGGGEVLSAGVTVMSLPKAGKLTLRSEGAIFSYRPNADYHGSDQFIYTEANGRRTTVSITITPVPDAPVLDRDLPVIANQGRLFYLELKGSDADGDELSYTADKLPDWLVLDSRTGVLSGVPQQTDIGLVEGIVLKVIDGTGFSDVIIDYQLEVVDLNDPPSLNITQVPTQFYGRETVTFNVFPDDLDSDAVVISVEPHPAFTAIVDGNEITLVMSDFEQAETTALTIVGRDERGAVVRKEIPVRLFPRTASGKGITVSGYKDDRGVNIVILGDGYTIDEQGTFRDHVEGVLENIRSDEGIARHLGAFNIHMIETVSNQSGSDDNDRDNTVDTVFDSTYNCRSIPRLVCADVLKLYEASLAEYPAVDQIILLVNDIRFGGSGNSGGRVAITSATFPEIALHEMGHSLADLADEYVDPLILETSGLPPFEEGRFTNVSTLNDPLRVPWSHWIDSAFPLPQTAGDEGVGVFEGGFYRATGVYRATFDSRMRNYASPFGPVNTEQWILRLYTLTGGIRDLQPQVQYMQSVAGEPQEFIVEPIFGKEVQAISWSLNGEALIPDGVLSDVSVADASAGNATVVDAGITVIENASSGGAIKGTVNSSLTRLILTLPPGQHQLTATVTDTSGRIKVSPPHAGIFTWNWSISAL